MKTSRVFHVGAVVSLVFLILWLVAWEAWLAPIRPGAWLLALKAVPLLVPLLGALKRDIYTLQWSSMVILLYFAEGAVRVYSDTAPLSRMMAGGEAFLVAIYFVCTVLFLRPYKLAAKKIAKELLERVNTVNK
ncbi:DUF2069 domain-containing protein [Massilia arenosa]|uniref:DUF2069 domain-containing protein n=1 Tax=Zemynaea arenosa TaxID=2561931 RepID=A0A4Y9RUL5_9BURK|nr:DUF2069 domain-containing protein [Massilia arenosa]TFW11309.1 DUF2069 domain-containing protein [Massilia arenosa]